MIAELTYATLCEATVKETNGDSYTYGIHFKTLQSAIDWAETMIDCRPISFEIDNIYITDVRTGEVLAICKPDEEEDPDSDWGFNEDMGYDPYMGCYTDDC